MSYLFYVSLFFISLAGMIILLIRSARRERFEAEHTYSEREITATGVVVGTVVSTVSYAARVTLRFAAPHFGRAAGMVLQYLSRAWVYTGERVDRATAFVRGRTQVKQEGAVSLFLKHLAQHKEKNGRIYND